MASLGIGWRRVPMHTLAASLAIVASAASGAADVAKRTTDDPAFDAEGRPRIGAVFRDCPECPDMVVVPGGRFDMGDLAGTGKPEERPVYTADIAAFAIARTELTRAQWQALAKPTEGQTGCRNDDCPVGYVAHDQAQDFLKALSTKTGRRYRLPSEAEWEYACRAGGRHRYCGGDDVMSLAWVRDNTDADGETRPVAARLANAFGLHDLSGNTMEWTADCWHGSHAGAPADGSARRGGDCNVRVVRGGASSFSTEGVRASARIPMPASEYAANLGFRPVRVLVERYRAWTDRGYVAVPLRWIDGVMVDDACARQTGLCIALNHAAPITLPDEAARRYGGHHGARFCAEIGANLRIMLDANNNQDSFCHFADGSLAGAWDLLARHQRQVANP